MHGFALTSAEGVCFGILLLGPSAFDWLYTDTPRVRRYPDGPVRETKPDRLIDSSTNKHDREFQLGMGLFPSEQGRFHDDGF